MHAILPFFERKQILRKSTSSYFRAKVEVSSALCPLKEVVTMRTCPNILINQGYTCGRFGSTVPFSFAVSGPPSPFLLLFGSFVMSVECFVSVLERPSCLPLCEFLPPADLEAAALWYVSFQNSD